MVTNGKVADFLAFLDNRADKFMAADKVWRTLEVATVKMQIRTLLVSPGSTWLPRTTVEQEQHRCRITYAKRSRGDFEHSICRLLELGIRSVFNRNLWQLDSAGCTRICNLDGLEVGKRGVHFEVSFQHHGSHSRGRHIDIGQGLLRADLV